MLDPKYIPLFLGGFILWMVFIVGVGFFGSRGRRSGEKFLTGGADMNLFLIFCTLGATIIGTGSSIGAIGDGFNHGWGGAGRYRRSATTSSITESQRHSDRTLGHVVTWSRSQEEPAAL